jgi:hypothetical protein
MNTRCKAISISALALALGTVSVALACGETLYAPRRPKVTEPGVKGEVLTIQKATSDSRTGHLGRMLVVGTKKPGVMLDRALVTVTNKTVIRKVVEGRRLIGAFGDLRKGMVVKAWFTGPIAKSYPAQATASEILLY